ncbi:thiol-disulfide oxidoreductase DCC family protein [Rhizobium leguminosarum]|uniref:thiol-disulfide oxidoreductase DCC family protein n=1 Tax=Rhizobium leguminosarum TaxID=384 RepID=UPI0014416DA8|nr:DCC1-like thiol-disulfide oxidoreductase family protein [Rhizobium leguminosarum]MBY5869069.1 DUF393 domain-containing protein [Rhizobium leguminosarum]NKM09259.1 DUF393 domain-containing protein [Rhizobium leguminosarum bv. viciae]
MANIPASTTLDSQTWTQRSAMLLGAVVVTGLIAYFVTSFFALGFLADRLMIFFTSLAAVTICLVIPAASASIARQLNWLAEFLDRRGAFRSNPAEEAPKFAMIRIAFGVLLAIRSFWLMYYLTAEDWGSLAVALPAITSMIGGIAVAAGFFAQPTLLSLILFQWQAGDWLLGTSTLGNDIAAFLAILLVFANAGAHLSIDGLLRRRQNLVGRLIAATYYQYGITPTATLQITKLATLFGYWCVCVYSLGIHLGEPAWMQGVAGPQLLTNNFMSRYGDEFASVLSSSEIAVFLTRISLWGMLPWYLLLLPCVVFGGLARLYALFWASLFFTLSLIVLRLGWLAEFEFLFFAALFWQKAFLVGPKTLQVAYDDRCNLCDRTVKFVKAVDVFNRVDLKPLSENQPWLIQHGINPDNAQKDLYGVKAGSGGRAAKGYDFYLMLSSEVLLLLPFYPLLFVGQFLGGRSVYRFVADRRTKLFGVCQVPTPKKGHEYLPTGGVTLKRIQSGDPVTIMAVHMLLLGAVYLTTIPTPYIFISAPGPVQQALAAVRPLGDAAHVYGITPIDVFNRTDLRMAENWFTISKLDGDAETLLPILDEAGKRLDAHRSDRVYFGNTLAYRRGVIDSKGCNFEGYKASIAYLTKSVSGIPGEYRYRQYFRPLPQDALLMKGIYESRPTSIVCETDYQVH